MKKFLLAIAIIALGFGASAQGGFDSFTSDWGDNSNRDMVNPTLLTMPGNAIGDTGNANAPLGSGLIILGALGAGYAVARKRK